MKGSSPPGVVRHHGLTLVELTLCIATLLFLNSILIVASRSWKRCGDRANCVLTLRNMQFATRAYQNMHGYAYGSQPAEENGTRNIATLMYAGGYIDMKLHQQATGGVPCPAGGDYIVEAPDLFPSYGHLYMTCSLAATAGHVPQSHGDW